MAIDKYDAAGGQLEEQEVELARLREALIVGEQSGPARAFDADAFLARLHAEPRAVQPD